ncbi:DedA family protein [Conyzicola sp.]|uniref:DedA family protein n=1 Tax=Conyzicola sp. TaxID=1969404 RepID=UPI0039899DC9
MEYIADATLVLAASPWVYVVVFVLTVLDAFFIIVPSETVVVALGALALSTGSPELAVLIPVAAVAATIGDSLTFWLGRTVGLERFAWMRRPRVARVLGWAGRSLAERAAAVLLTARFIPFGRIAVNLTAGASAFAYPRFLALTAIAGVCWASYNALIGALFGSWFDGNPVLAVAISVSVALVLGVLVDRATARLTTAWNSRRK